VETSRPQRYAFGDTSAASRRLGVLASVFAPTSRTLLDSLGATADAWRAPSLVLDLGCGPGHTSAMLADAFPSALVLGIDTSAAFVREAARTGSVRTGSARTGSARTGSARCRFVLGDVTRMPLPCAPADLVYGRFLLVHLPDPRATVTAWAKELAPGGMVVVEEPERIDTDDADFRRYLELADAVVADRGGDLYVGHDLFDLTPPPHTSLVVHRDAPLEVTAGSAASIFSLNLGIWSADPAVDRIASRDEISALLARLEHRRSDATAGVIRWHMRQVVMARRA